MRNPLPYFAVGGLLLLNACGSGGKSALNRSNVRPCSFAIGNRYSVAETKNIAFSGITGKAATNFSVPVNIYDDLGFRHPLIFLFTPNAVDAHAPSGALVRWDWEVTENGALLANSTAFSGASPIYWGAGSFPLDTTKPTFRISPTNGAPVFAVDVDFRAIRLYSDPSFIGLTQVAAVQDGFPVGTLATLHATDDGHILLLFSNGQLVTIDSNFCKL